MCVENINEGDINEDEIIALTWKIVVLLAIEENVDAIRCQC